MISILIPSGILLALYWAKWAFLPKKGKCLPLTIPLAFTCLFVPKINLIDINRTFNTAGIRIDDILALALLIVALRDASTYKNKYIKWGIGFLLALTAAGLISMFVGRANGFDNNVLFSILSIGRKYEYFAFALIGIYLARHTEQAEKTILEEFTWMSGFHALIGLLQVFGVCNYAVSGIVDYSPDYWNGMAISTFNGHYEYAQFLCFAIAIYLCVFIRTKRIGWLGMLAVSLVMLWLTKSRTSLIVGMLLIILILFFSIWTVQKKRLKYGALAGMLLILTAGALIATGTLKIGRFAVVDLNEYSMAWNHYAGKADIREYAEMVRNGVSVESQMTSVFIDDGSAMGRFVKWGAALDGFRRYPAFGYGTGVTQVMDGNYFKLLGEGGLIGTLLHLAMFGYFMKAVWAKRKHVHAARSVWYMMFSILAASLFIDMFEASKPMEMMWLAVGFVIGPADLIKQEQNPAVSVPAGKTNRKRAETETVKNRSVGDKA